VTGFPDGSDVGYEKTKGVKHDPKISHRMSATGTGKTAWKSCVGWAIKRVHM
jgi:hypothetical protein